LQTIQSRIPAKFNGMRSSIEQLSDQLAKDPSSAVLFDSVVQQELNQVPPAERPQVMARLKTQRENKERNTQIGALASAGLMLGSFLPVGRLTATGLRLVGIGIGGGVAASQIPDLELLNAAAQAGHGGNRLTSQSPEEAKSNLIMGYTNVALAGLDVGLEVGAVQKLAAVSGKLAMSGVQVSRQQWSQVLSLTRQGPAGVEQARALLAKVTGVSKEKAAETIQLIKNGLSPQVETVGVPGQSAVKTTEENVKDAKQALQAKTKGGGSGKATEKLSSIPINATSQQVKQIRRLLKEHNIDENALALTKYFEKSKDNIDNAISKLEKYLENPNPKLRNHSFADKKFTFDTPELKVKYPGLEKKYPNGVNFTKDGYPDFSPYAVPGGTVKINMIGNYTTDFTDATKLARQNGVPEDILMRIQKDYTWHHSEDMRTMQLVPLDIHRAVRHSGGISRIETLNKLSNGR
jgi:hypothetical protein